MLKKHISLALVTGFMLVLAMTGCNATKAHKADNVTAENKITLNVWHQWSNDTNELKQKYVEAVEQYEKDNPGITINTKTLDTEAYKAKISAEFTGEAKNIDVFYYWGAGTAKKLVDADKLLPLDDYLSDEERSRIVEGAKAAFTYDGKLYSLPSFSWYSTLFCNKKIFEQAGAKLPTTYDELVDAVKKINKLGGITPIASGARDGWNAALIYQAFALREVGAKDINKMLSGEEGFDNTGYRKAAEKVVSLYNMNAFGNNPLEQGNDDANAEFGAGKAAMRLMGSWYANAIYTDKNYKISPEDVVAMKIPMISKKGKETDYCGGFVESFWANKHTEHPKEAARFAIYINEKMGVAAYETGSGFCGWRTTLKDTGVNPLFIEIKNLMNEGKTGVLAWDTSLAAGPADVHNQQVQMLFLPNANVDEFVEKNKNVINK